MTKRNRQGILLIHFIPEPTANALLARRPNQLYHAVIKARVFPSTVRRTGMDRAVARASQAYRDNEVALDDGHVHKDHSLEHHAAVQPSGHSARNLHHVKSAKNLRTAAAVTVNLRDCGAISRILRQGRMFRSSQVMRYIGLKKFMC